MRVLLVSGWQIHPARSGGTLRSFGLANSLAHNGFEVAVYSLAGRRPDYLARRASAVQVWPEGIEEYVDRSPAGLLTQLGSSALGWPPLLSAARLRLGAASPGGVLLPRRLRAQIDSSDVVICDFPFLHSVFDARGARGKLRVLSTHNIEHHVYADDRFWSRRLRAAVRANELRAARRCDLLVACCEADVRFFEEHARPRRSVVVPNGIDTRRLGGIEVHRQETRAELGLADDVRLFLFTASSWPPNREAYAYLLDFAQRRGSFLVEKGIHLLVIGNVVGEPVRLPGFTATGRVERAEPYFAAADAALNPMFSGAGTNVKVCEFMAARLPLVTTLFGARGYEIEDGSTGFLFERDGLEATLARVRGLFDTDPQALKRIAVEAHSRNLHAIEMDVCVRPLVAAIGEEMTVRRGAHCDVVSPAQLPTG